MHGIGRLPILGVLAIVVLTQTVMGYNLVVDEVGGNVSVSITPIDETFYGPGKITIAIFNNLNKSIDITVDSGEIVPSDSSFTIPPKDSHVIYYEFKKDYSGRFRYVISSSDFQKVVYQDVNVDVKGAGISFPKEVAVTLEERGITKKFITFINTGDVPIDVKIDVSGSEAVVAVVPNEFRLEEGDSFSVAYIIYGKNDTEYIPVVYNYNNETEVIMQKVTINTTPMQEVVQKEEELRNYEELVKKLKLEGQVKLEVPKKVKVGQQVVIKAQLNGKPIDNALLLIESGDFSNVISLSSGMATFTPKWSGEYDIQLINGLGDVVASKSIAVSRAKWNLTIPDQIVGQEFVINLPEVASVKVLKENSVVFSGDGKSSYNITLSEPGTYILKFYGKKYEGSSTFKVTGTVSITITQGDKVILPGSTITAGSPIKVSATISGIPVKGTVRVMYPANAYGYDERDISVLMLQQMFMQMYMSTYGSNPNTSFSGSTGMTFVPPNNIVVEYPLSSATTIPIPDSTSGYVTITFITEDGEVAGQYMIKVTPKTLLKGYEPYVVVVLIIALVVTILYKSGLIAVPDKLKVKIGVFRGKLKKGTGDLPDLD